MSKLWFKAKEYGYGWYPVSIEGWMVLLIYVGFNVWNALRIDEYSHSVSDTLINFVPQVLISTIILIAICVKKGEPARWRWGGKP